MMSYLEGLGWTCRSCITRWFRGAEYKVLATDDDPDMLRQCVECGC